MRQQKTVICLEGRKYCIEREIVFGSLKRNIKKGKSGKYGKLKHLTKKILLYTSLYFTFLFFFCIENFFVLFK